jgi:hypothetical protein
MESKGYSVIYCRVARLDVSGVGSFPVFSGLGELANKPECSYLENAAVPPGSYWIVDRPSGGARTSAETFFKHAFTGNNYYDWFALYRKDGVVDDYMRFDVGSFHYNRGHFRLHPPRPDGSGISEGCITFFRSVDFYVVRRALLRAHQHMILGGNGLRAYGEVTVIGNTDGVCNVKTP